MCELPHVFTVTRTAETDMCESDYVTSAAGSVLCEVSTCPP
jgi:hypothetical protein